MNHISPIPQPPCIKFCVDRKRRQMQDRILLQFMKQRDAVVPSRTAFPPVASQFAAFLSSAFLSAAFRVAFSPGIVLPLAAFPVLHMLQTVQKCLNPCHHTNCRLVFIYLHRQIWLLSHDLTEQMRNHRIWSASMIGQIHRIQIRMIFYDLGSG